MRGSGSTLSPRPFPIQGKGAALEDISPVAPWEVAQPGQPVKGAEHRRAAAALPLTGSPGCAMGGAATGDKSGRDSVDGTVKTGGGASGHDVQNTYKNTAPILLEAVLCVRLTAYYVISFLFPFVKRRLRHKLKFGGAPPPRSHPLNAAGKHKAAAFGTHCGFVFCVVVLIGSPRFLSVDHRVRLPVAEL